MIVQISNTQHQNVKSNSKRKVYLNLEDILFQISVLKLGITYHQTMMTTVRTMKGYNHHQNKVLKLEGVHGLLQMSDLYKRYHTQASYFTEI